MVSNVNSVFVANAIDAGAPSTVDNLVIEAGVADATGKVAWSPATAANAATAAKIRIGLVEEKMDIELNGAIQSIPSVRYTQEINKGEIKSIVCAEYKDAVEDSVKITFGTNFNVEVGHRYVVRILRTDLTEHPGPLTYSYEHIAKTNSTEDLIKAIAKKITKDRRPGVKVENDATSITLTALAKTDNSTIPSLILYSQITFEVAVFKTIPTGLLTNHPIELIDVKVEKSQGHPGDGNWKIVRDREDYALAYRGVDFRANGIFPYVAPELRVKKDAKYNTVTVLYDKKFRSNDMNYMKSTPLCVELYMEDAAAFGTVSEVLSAFAKA